MHATKVEIALGRDIGNVCGYTALFAQFPDLSRGFRVVDCAEDHISIVKIVRLKVAVDMGNLILVDAIGDFLIQAGPGANDSYFGIGIEGKEYTAGRYLCS